MRASLETSDRNKTFLNEDQEIIFGIGGDEVLAHDLVSVERSGANRDLHVGLVHSQGALDPVAALIADADGLIAAGLDLREADAGEILHGAQNGIGNAIGDGVNNILTDTQGKTHGGYIPLTVLAGHPNVGPLADFAGNVKPGKRHSQTRSTERIHNVKDRVDGALHINALPYLCMRNSQ